MTEDICVEHVAPESASYLSDDRNLELRRTAPVACQMCRKLDARDSMVTGKPLIDCCAPSVNNPDAGLVGRLLMRLAAITDSCSEFEEIGHGKIGTGKCCAEKWGTGS